MANCVRCSARMLSGAERVAQLSSKRRCGFTLAGAGRPTVRRPSPFNISMDPQDLKQELTTLTLPQRTMFMS